MHAGTAAGALVEAHGLSGDSKLASLGMRTVEIREFAGNHGLAGTESAGVGTGSVSLIHLHLHLGLDTAFIVAPLLGVGLGFLGAADGQR